jgi:hypothetical protein
MRHCAARTSVILKSLRLGDHRQVLVAVRAMLYQLRDGYNFLIASLKKMAESQRRLVFPIPIAHMDL